LNPTVAKLIKEILFNSPLRRYFFPVYLYNFSPPQLCFLCQCIDDTKDIDGAVAEVGCAAGATTVFLNMYMSAQDIEKTYYAIDTFSGFVRDDIKFEVAHRGKTTRLFAGFQANKKKWFDGTMRNNNINGVVSIEADVHKFDFTTIGNLSFCLLDLDLYRPMKRALRELYDILSPGGVIVVDDCDSSNVRWDGSDQAYKEFMKEIDCAPKIIHGKLGVIRKPV
jgi:SAM-dependent methyltransferase